MPDTSAAPDSEIVIPVAYDGEAGAAVNFAFAGDGTLVVDPGAGTFRFRGRARGEATGGETEVLFRAGEVANVTADGRMVQFLALPAREGATGAPFRFFLRDEATARRVADLLPRHVALATDSSNAFADQLEAMAGRAPWWASPTTIIIGLNVAMFVLMGFLGTGWFQTESMRPYLLFGANNGAATTDGEWWRLLTSMFVHYGLLHLAFNLWALYQAGHFIERILGRAAFVLMYLASGIAGGLVSIGWHGDKTWSAGASGAVFGVYGAILGYSLRYRHALPPGVYRSMRNSTLAFAAYNIAFGAVQRGIDNAAHVGGFAGGLVFGFLLALPLERAVRRRATGGRLALGALALGAILAAGIGLTPRFDYRVRDELAWEETVRGFSPMERQLLEENRRRVRGLSESGWTAYAEWIESRLVPLYTDWAQRLERLTLAPDRATARNRDAFVTVFRRRAVAYQRLAAELKAADPEAFLHFADEDERIAALTENIAPRSKPR